MKTTDSVMREFWDRVIEVTPDEIKEGESVKLVSDKDIEWLLSHSLAEARREERTKILDGIDRWIGDTGYPLHDCEYGKCHSNTKELIKHLRSDLLTGDNPEEAK